MAAAAGLLVLALVGPARATPEDHLSSEVSVLCTGADRVVLWARTVGNAGTYYITDTAWHLVMIDTATGEAQWHDQGGLVRNTVNMVDPDDEAEVTHRTGVSPSLGEALQQWGMTDCRRNDRARLWGPDRDARLGVVSREEGVFLTFGDAERQLEVAGAWDPSALAVAQFPCCDAPETLPVGEPFSMLGGAESLELLRLIPLRTHTAILVRARSEFGNRDVVLAASSDQANRTAAYLLNAHGMGVHRAQDFDRSAVWFQEALRFDAGWEVPRYNLACAQARQGQADVAVRQLQELPATAALRAKIEGDSDFDGVRADEVFEGFVAGLPTGE
jgi:hypothetical protein